MIYKFNPFTGNLDTVRPDNFSYNVIPTGKTVRVPTNQQMLVDTSLDIVGVLDIEGQVIVLQEDYKDRIKETNQSEAININGYELIRQTASGIITTLTGATAGSRVAITNRSGGNNTLNITVQGTASPTIYDLETFTLVYNGTDYDLT